MKAQISLPSRAMRTCPLYMDNEGTDQPAQPFQKKVFFIGYMDNKSTYQPAQPCHKKVSLWQIRRIYYSIQRIAYIIQYTMIPSAQSDLGLHCPNIGWRYIFIQHCPIIFSTSDLASSFYHSMGKFSRWHIDDILLFFPKNMIWQFMQIVSIGNRMWHFMHIVSIGDSFQMSKPVVWEKIKKNISICNLLKILTRVQSLKLPYIS